MYQLQNLDVCYFDNQETDDCKKVFDKGKYNVIDQASLVDEKPGYATKDTHINEVKQILDKKACPPLVINSILWYKKRNTNLINSFPRISLKKQKGFRAQE